ncbi:MAG: MFS transporter [Proteobacteria bacterium]|nr:MFS transporter [Pseudomonadota bacterium]
MNTKLLRALIIGNVLEYYDFFLYSFFVSILSPLFFPSSDSLTALMMGFSVFAVGFIARPIGALIFGHWGDKYGRKNALFYTLLLMAISTIGIGFLPTYEMVGLLAPALLIFFRLLQGLSAGGEVNGVAIFGLEQTIETRQGFIGAVINSSAGIGAILATTIGAIVTASFMPHWAWRIPFYLGGLVALVGLYLRKALNENTAKTVFPVPLLVVIRNYPLSFLKAVGVGGFLHVPFYIIVGYMNPTLHAKGLITSTELMLMNMAVTLFGVSVMPLLGHYSDKISPRRMMVWGALGQMILAFPIFLIYIHSSVRMLFLAQIGFLMFAEAFIAPSNAYLNKLFPSECRYSGIAFGSCFGTAIFGGTTPIICNQLAQNVGPLWGPTLYIIGTALMGLIAVIQLKRLFLKTANV